MISLADGSSRLGFTNESMSIGSESILPQRRAASYDELSRAQLISIWWPHVLGFATVISGIIMLCMAWPRRKFVFHRLVLVMATHQVLYGLMYTLGTIMIPREYGEYYDNFGTIGTCTLQGFVLFVSIRASAIYYGCFSLYSCVAVLNDFDQKKYKWCEKWIHMFVQTFTLAMAFYGLAVEGYNPVLGFCKMASYPIDCETSDEVDCVRGPATYGKWKAIGMRLIPLCLYVVIPTIAMIFLYFKVKSREKNPAQTKGLITSKEVATQACVYLAPLYMASVPFFISAALEYFKKLDDESLLPVTLTGLILFTLFGLWSMLSYWYFSTDLTPNKQEVASPSNADANKSRHGVTQLIFNTDASRKTAARLSGVSDSVATKKEQNETSEEEEPERRYSFNIFDGTNAGGAFSEFIHDGDSEDERLDKEDTDRWKEIQDHI